MSLWLEVVRVRWGERERVCRVVMSEVRGRGRERESGVENGRKRIGVVRGRKRERENILCKIFHRKIIRNSLFLI